MWKHSRSTVMADQSHTYSVMLRVQRVTYEDAYVAVPVTAAILTTNVDGTVSIDSGAFVAEAIRMSHDPRVEWIVESSHLEPHPIQQPKPDDRQCLDSFADRPTV